MYLTELDTFDFENVFDFLTDILDSTFMIPTAIMNIFSFLPPTIQAVFFVTIIFSIMGGMLSVILRII